jgi:formate hydrogenlyase subunit 3/multisubunit Na+/H+ antiporter MnhD subunit
MNSLPFMAIVGWPLVLAGGLASRRTRRVARQLAPWAALPALLAAVPGVARYEYDWMLFGGMLGLDEIAAVMLPVTAGLWLAAGVFAQHYLEPGARRDIFFGCFLAALSGNLLLLVALDAVAFYLGFALMSFAAYGLVVHEGDARARHAARYYITLVVIGEVCVISALMLLATHGATDFPTMRAILLGEHASRLNLTVGLLLAGFGIKVGIFGLHFWLPLAHPVAPAPASAVLSGAMIKAGLIGWMRLLPLGELALPHWGAGLAALGLFTAYYGALAGIPQREPKAVLAYSSVSQMGVMTMAIGVGLAYPAQWPALSAALLIYMAHHSLVKGGLFIGAGLVRHPLAPVTARLVAIALCLGALALAGGPLTGGLVAKLALKHGATLASAPWGRALPALLILSSGLTALLMLRFLWLAWPRSAVAVKPPALGLLVPWALLVLAWLAVPWMLAGPALRLEALGLAAAWSAVWPVALAGLLAWILLQGHRSGRLGPLPPVPPGDLGIPLENAAAASARWLGGVMNTQLPRFRDACASGVGTLARSGPGWVTRLGSGEARIAAWSITGALLLLLATSFAWLLA